MAELSTQERENTPVDLRTSSGLNTAAYGENRKVKPHVPELRATTAPSSKKGKSLLKNNKQTAKRSSQRKSSQCLENFDDIPPVRIVNPNPVVLGGHAFQPVAGGSRESTIDQFHRLSSQVVVPADHENTLTPPRNTIKTVVPTPPRNTFPPTELAHAPSQTSGATGYTRDIESSQTILPGSQLLSLRNQQRSE
eukprot:GHVT01052459.1.p1 GENE.GHVT01052459.1~~GHVT01052459.1.p1  ORF type:complete len:204 (-),score=9.53 GHVT01052459.1:107-688(-)